jgi:hypothetical protein
LLRKLSGFKVVAGFVTHTAICASARRFTPGGFSSFFIENERRDVLDHHKARQVNDRTNGQEDERDPNG